MPRGPFVPIPNVAKVEIIGHDIGDNRTNVCVLAMHFPPGGTEAELITAAAVYDTFLGNMSPHTNGEVQWDTIVLTDLNSATGPQATVATTRGGSGGDSPPGFATVIETKSASRGRSYNGRIFWPTDGGDVTNATGFVGSTTIGGITTQWGVLETGLAALSPTSFPVVVSRKLHIGTQIVAVVVRPEIGRIRRRAFG
jgi:hypothetical protein